MEAKPSVSHPPNLRNQQLATTATTTTTTTPHNPSLPRQIITFFALYLTTLFSLDAFAAARNSPHRAPASSSAAIYRPANTPSEYQAGMHGRGAGGPRTGGGGGAARGNGGGMGEVRDSRPPIGMGSTAACGACMT